MRSADSLAMSVAVSTEMPMSAARQGRSVVDSVAHESDDVPLAAEDADDALLVGRREAGEERGFSRRLAKLGVGHLLHVAAQEHRVGRKTHVLANLPADQVVIPG